MQATVVPGLGETIYRDRTVAGLRVVVLPKPGFHKTEVHLAVGFGSIDEDGAVGVAGGFPQGTAHFLEHMLFENEDNDPTAAFARLGAQVNAFTAPDVTDYFFATTNGWEDPARLLFRLVLRPTFAPAAIAKEREIIAREIQMYEDDMGELILEDLLGALYRRNPVKNPIAGTKTSIAGIDAAVLAAAHSTYYVPANLLLLVVGDVDPEAVFALAAGDPLFVKGTEKPVGRHLPESRLPAKTAVVRHKDIHNDMVMLGVKFDRPTPATPFENDVEELLWSFVLDALFAKTSPNQQELVRKGFINEGFEANAQCEEDFGHIVIYTESKRPDAAAKALWALLDEADRHLDVDRFETAKRRLVGNYIQAFNSVSTLAGFLLDYELEGVDVFRLITAADALTLADVRKVLFRLSADARTQVIYRQRKK